MEAEWLSCAASALADRSEDDDDEDDRSTFGEDGGSTLACAAADSSTDLGDDSDPACKPGKCSFVVRAANRLEQKHHYQQKG